MNYTVTVWTEIFGEEVPVEISGDYTKGTPAKLYGLPEDCYPEEFAELSIESAMLSSIDISGIFSEEQVDEIEVLVLAELWAEEDEP